MMKKLYFILLILFSYPAFSQFNYEFSPPEKIISLYPNPAKSTLWVKVNHTDITTNDLSVYNIIGEKLNLSPEKEEDGKFSIDVDDLPGGYYLLVVENKALQVAKTVKFIIKK